MNTDKHISSYPKVYNMGHPALEALLDGPVVVQEKVDGSQFSFANIDGELVMRSKGTDLFVESSDKLFAPAIATAKRLFDESRLVEGYVYRGEVLAKPKHNTISYAATPPGNVILFDVEYEPDRFMSPTDMRLHAATLGLHSVATLMRDTGAGGYVDGSQLTLEKFEALLNITSSLGGSTIEGVVIKNHNRWGKDGKFLAGKHVSEVFKETHKKAWREGNPTRQDVVEKLIDELRSPMRWEKAVQHMRERGELTETPRDIGPLLKEAKNDIDSEERDYIAEKLLAHFLPQILRGSTGGLAEWYKKKLLEKQFEEDESDD